MRFHIITLFPEALRGYLSSSIIGRAIAAKHLSVTLYNPRDFTRERNRRVDRRPYGGGPGMVIEAEPILRAVDKIRKKRKDVKIIFLSPRGKMFTDARAKALSRMKKDIVLIAGHYEGIDARVKTILKPEVFSIGPYILTGGELPALTIVDATARFIPGVLGEEMSLETRRLAPGDRVYTRPEKLLWTGKTYRVPKVLLSGHHANIEAWRGRGTTEKSRRERQ